MQSTDMKIDNSYITGLEELQAEWAKKDKELLLTGTLAYWTYWLSKHAEKTGNQEEKNNLFSLKKNGLLLLTKSNYVQIRKFIPTHHKKLCYSHSKMQKKRKMNAHQFLSKNELLIGKCPECQNGQEHYFSLYSLALLNEIEDIENRKPYFIMFMPYVQASHELPGLDSLKSVKRYSGGELCTIRPNQKAYKVDLKMFSPVEILEHYIKSYNDLMVYFKV